MDGETWSQYEKLQSGGTPVAAIAATRFGQKPRLNLAARSPGTNTAGTVLQKKFNVAAPFARPADRHP